MKRRKDSPGEPEEGRAQAGEQGRAERRLRERLERSAALGRGG